MRLLTFILLLLATTAPLQAQRVLPFGSGITGSLGVYDMVEHDGKLVIAGMYGTFLGHARNNIQAWDGSTHFDLPGAFTATPQRVRDLEVFNGDLIATGNEATFGHVARWDGSAWQAMGAGLPAQGMALCILNNELYAAANDGSVVRWDGSAWQPVGTGFNGVVRVIAAHAGQLYAGGDFDQDAGNSIQLRHLARWTGTAWEEVGQGLNNAVWGLLSDGTDLVVAGNFTARGDGTLTLPLWSVFNGTDLTEPAFAIPGATLIEDIQPHPAGGYVLGGNAQALWVRNTTAAPIRFGPVRGLLAYGGNVLIGGMGGESYVPVEKIGRLVDGTDLAFLDANTISAAFMPWTSMMSLPTAPGFEAPQGSGLHTVYSTSPWVVGDLNGTLHSAAPMYDPEAPTSGPNATLMDSAFYARYHQVWELDQATIADHIQHWNDGGYVMPHAIATWPGNGDVANGEPAQLAPYADLDEDGLYEPADGEYPLIRGDEAVFLVLHSVPDADGLHPGMTLDIAVMHYAYGDSTDADRFNTVFSNYRIINRSGDTYTSARMGHFTDFDLGYSLDDRVGCDSTTGLFYAYNGDGLDDNGYGTDIPAQGALFLNAPMTAHRTYGDGITLEDAINGTQFGAPFTEPGYPTHFQFPGGSWTDSGAPGDRRSVGSIGPFTLGAGDTICVDVAYPFARAANGDPQASLIDLLARAQALKTWYAGQNGSCGEVVDIHTRVTPNAAAAPLRLAPNPADAHTVLHLPAGTSASIVQLFDATGRLVTAPQRALADQLVLDTRGLKEGLYLVRVGEAHPALRLVVAH